MGGITLTVMAIVVGVSAVLSGWLGYKLAGGQVYGMVLAGIMGFMIGVLLFPTLVRLWQEIRWAMRKRN